MTLSAFATEATAAYPDPGPIDISGDEHFIRPSMSPAMSSSDSITSTSSESEQTAQRPVSRRSRIDRPRMQERQRSSSIIVPKNRINENRTPTYAPDDARAMSPRRNSHDIERLELGVRTSLKEQARTLQSSLAALAEKIDEVKQDHDKLESENKFLQDYIGGLTRTMSKDSNLGRSSSSSAKKRGKR